MLRLARIKPENVSSLSKKLKQTAKKSKLNSNTVQGTSDPELVVSLISLLLF